MSVTLTDLLTAPTVEESKASIYAVLAALGVPTTAWKPKGVVRPIIYVVAALVTAVTVIVALVARSGFRLLATGDWKTLTCSEVYGVDRIAATFASGNVVLTNGGGGVFNVDVGDFTVQNGSTLATFHNTTAFTLAAGGTATVPVIADVAGISGTSAANAVTTIVTAMLGVTCTNAVAFVGTDEETDAELDLRTDGTLDAISPNGAAGAYLAVARTATLTDGTLVGVTRVKTNNASSTGAVVVTCATASGALTSPELTAVQGAILTGPNSPVPLGIASCTVQSATGVTLAVTGDVYVYTTDGRDVTALETAASAALDAWIAARPIGGDGGYVYHDALEAAVKSISAYAYRAVVSTPAGDTALSATQVAVAGSHTITAHLVAP